MATSTPVRLSFVLIALLLAVMLAGVAPTDCGCPFDIHHGAAFHPVFDHPHPDTPASDDDLQARPSTSQIGTGAAAVGLNAPPLLGILHAMLLPFALQHRRVGTLVPAHAVLPSSYRLPPDPPPPRHI